MTSSKPLRVALLALCCVCFACTDDGGNTETGADETTAAELSGAILRLELDATSLCAGSIDRIEFATRRRGCWDPELPCTSPTNPPWETGTTATCADLAESQVWEIGVDMSGQYETQLRALTADDTQEGLNCYADPSAPNGLTQVANADVDTERVFDLTDSASGCTNP